MNFFVLNGHKYYPYSEGRLNKTLFDQIVMLVKPNNDVKTTIIEDGYDINEELEKFNWADIIIFQTPVNWFSIPWTFKKYIDELYLHGIFYKGSNAYGNGGIMKGKKYMYSFTLNPSENDFGDFNKFFNGKSPEDFFIALHKIHQYAGMEPIKSYFCFNAVHNPDIGKYLGGLEEHINNYIFRKEP